MPPSQLWRAVLSPSELSADEQDATVDDDGSYGELMDAIDQALERSAPDEGDPAG
jgi:hypothetical protein